MFGILAFLVNTKSSSLPFLWVACPGVRSRWKSARRATNGSLSFAVGRLKSPSTISGKPLSGRLESSASISSRKLPSWCGGRYITTIVRLTGCDMDTARNSNVEAEVSKIVSGV